LQPRATRGWSPSPPRHHDRQQEGELLRPRQDHRRIINFDRPTWRGRCSSARAGWKTDACIRGRYGKTTTQTICRGSTRSRAGRCEEDFHSAGVRPPAPAARHARNDLTDIWLTAAKGRCKPSSARRPDPPKPPPPPPVVAEARAPKQAAPRPMKQLPHSRQVQEQHRRNRATAADQSVLQTVWRW